MSHQADSAAFVKTRALSQPARAPCGFISNGGDRQAKLRNQHRTKGEPLDSSSEVPGYYNCCCYRRAAAVPSGRPRQPAASPIYKSMQEPTDTTVRCYGCYGHNHLVKHVESQDGKGNVTDVTDVTPKRRGCTCRGHAPALARARPPVVDTPFNCRNIRNIRNIAVRRRGILLRQFDLAVTSVTCYGRWSA